MRDINKYILRGVQDQGEFFDKLGLKCLSLIWFFRAGLDLYVQLHYSH